MVDIDKMQYGFMPGRRTVHAVFVLRRLTKKYRSKSCFMCLLIWKKCLSTAENHLVCFKEEYLVQYIMSLYSGCKTVVSVDG